MRAALFFAFLLSPLSVGCFGGGGAYLTDPRPAYVPPGTPTEVVRAGILAVVDGRHHWFAESEQGNQIVAVLNSHNHIARVLISYDTQGVYIQYLDSQALSYYVDNTGRPRIHRNYNRWVQRLAQNIERTIPQMGQPGGGVPVIVFQP